MPDFSVMAVAAFMLIFVMAALKAIRAKQYWDVATMLVVLGVGIGLAFLIGASDFGSSVKVGDKTLADVNGASLVLAGFAIASLARFAFQATKAVDNAQSAAEPKLFTSPAEG